MVTSAGLGFGLILNRESYYYRNGLGHTISLLVVGLNPTSAGLGFGSYYYRNGLGHTISLLVARPYNIVTSGGLEFGLILNREWFRLKRSDIYYKKM